MPRVKPSETFERFKKRWAQRINAYLDKVCRTHVTEEEAFAIFEMAFLAPIQFGCEEYRRIWEGLMTDDEDIKDNLNKALMIDIPLLGKAGIQLRPHSAGRPPVWANLVPWTPRYVLTLGHVIRKQLMREVANIDVDVLRANAKTAKKLKTFKREDS